MGKFNTDFSTFANQKIAEFTDAIEDALSGYTSEGMADKMNKALDILEERTQRYVPVDTGATKNSWYRRVVVGKDSVEGQFGYNENGALDYVSFIYINPLSFIINTETSGQPDAKDHWLEIALEEVMPDMIKALSKT